MPPEPPGAGPYAARPLTRREALMLGWIASLGVLGASGAALLYRFARVDPAADPRCPQVDLGPIEGLPGPGEPPLSFRDARFWWVATDAGALALHKVCSRGDCTFDWKPIDGQFICPCCGAHYARDGTFLQGSAVQRMPRRCVVLDPGGELVRHYGSDQNDLPGARNLDRFVVRAYDAEGHEVARTDDSGSPFRIPPHSRVVVDISRHILGLPA